MIQGPASTCKFCGIFLGLAAMMCGQSASDKGIVVASATASYRLATPPAKGPSDSNAVPAADSEMARNESAVIDFCLEYVEAQIKYAQISRNAGGLSVFAQNVRSAPGKREGLYWAIREGEDESPVGPNVAAAAVTEQQPADRSRPFAGYYFKILMAQGPAALGGARDYRLEGRLVLGFALVAWPASYGVSGVRSFLINHLGDVYARDLGPDTSRIAAGLTVFDPDHNWTIAKVKEVLK
jgi:hypothetical protein